MEIEAKFRVADRRVFADILRLTHLGAFELTPAPGIERQHNTYFDTADRSLAARHYSLRVRDLGGRRIATVKRSLSTHAGVHTREEWQTEITAGDYPADWPASAARDQALAALNGATALPLITIRTNRQYIYATRASTTIAELSLDAGMIMAGERAATFRELEVELQAGGTRTDLDELIDLLQARFALIPESRGKRTRGMALLDQASDGAAPWVSSARALGEEEAAQAFVV